MTKYKYVDDNGNTMSVVDCPTTEHGRRIGLDVDTSKDDGRWMLLIKREDAPAVALAILEAAGIRPDALSGNREQRAAAYLKAWSVEHARQAEREAEDAKVRDYLSAIRGSKLNDDYRVVGADRDEFHRAQVYFAAQFATTEATP